MKNEDDLELRASLSPEGPKAPPVETQVNPQAVPEGGLEAWLIILGCSCLCFCIFGYIIAWGTFQAYYETVLLTSSTPSSIAWIGSLQYSLMFLPGLVTGRLFDLGYFRVSLAGSTVLYVLASFLIAECKVYWQFILCQGLALGLAGGWIYIPCVALVSHWFNVRRPMAYGVISVGTALGGIVYPILFRSLVPKIGFKWTVRAFAFINLGMFIIGHLTLKTRLPPKGKNGGVNLRGMLSAGYVVYVLSTFTAFLGMYTPLTFVTLSAEAVGVKSSLAFYLVAVINGTSAVGRLCAGVLSLRFGPINIMAASTVLAALFTYLWPFMDSPGSFIAVISLYGFFSGPFIGLFVAPAAQMGPAQDAGLRTGFQMTIMALGALAGPPISGAILDHYGSFKNAGLFAGTMILLGAIIMAGSKVLILHRIIGGKI